ncbi:MAG: Uma2 family endonuclease [Planctomycetes bacterium]|nr:Uma2 family endonuclease [Planctomycetota bacterium]
MASIQSRSAPTEVEYPDSDGQPVGETPQHCDNLHHLVEMLRGWFADDDHVYVAGNSFLYYVEGDPRRHISPDVFVVRGIPKQPPRRRYLVWEEKKAPDFVIELTSQSTMEEDLEDKFQIYRDILRVQEYFLFDPLDEFLEPRLRGFRLKKGEYVPIRRVKGRLPSKVLGLHLEPRDWELRLYDPGAEKWLPTPAEDREARLRAEAENERLRKELETLRRKVRE